MVMLATYIFSLPINVYIYVYITIIQLLPQPLPSSEYYTQLTKKFHKVIILMKYIIILYYEYINELIKYISLVMVNNYGYMYGYIYY